MSNICLKCNNTGKLDNTGIYCDCEVGDIMHQRDREKMMCDGFTGCGGHSDTKPDLNIYDKLISK